MFDILQVRVDNFRSYYGKHVFEFPTASGLYHLTGRNESNGRLGANAVGKSSLLDAIFWCLFGKTSRGLKATEIVSWGERQCSVSVKLVVGTAQFTVKRAQNPNSLTIHDAKGKHTVDQIALQKLLRLTPEAFSYAVMFPQFGSSFFDLAPAAKLTLFSQIMELDYWLDKSREADVLAKGLLESKFSHEQIMARLEGQLITIAEDVKTLKVKDQQFEDEKKQTLATTAAKIREEVKRSDALREELRAAKTALVNVDKKIAAQEGKAKICPACKQPIKNSDLQTLAQNHTDFSRRVQRLEHEREGVMRRVFDLNQDIDVDRTRKNPYADMIKEKVQARLEIKAKLTAEGQELDKVNEAHAETSFWVGGFKRVRLFIVEETLRQLELEVNNNLTSLGLVDWRIEFDVERETKAGGITKGFVVLIHSPGGERPIRWESFSGGETQRLRLAGDLGLANLIMERAGLSSQIEFYDEPSQHLSQEGLLDLAETLDERAVQANKRCWIIDHHLIDYGFTGKVTVIKDENGSRLTY